MNGASGECDTCDQMLTMQVAVSVHVKIVPKRIDGGLIKIQGKPCLKTRPATSTAENVDFY